MLKLLKIFFVIATISFTSIVSAGPIGFLDEFSTIYHSNVIIEVGVILDEYNHPKECFYIKKIKGDKSEVNEVMEKFSIEQKGGKKKPEQKRIMFFYKNQDAEWRCADLIKKGVGPYSTDPDYKEFYRMIKLTDKEMKKTDNLTGGVIDLGNEKFCRELLKNKYFFTKYFDKIESGKFSVGAEEGIFKEFSPLVRVKCD